MATMTAGTRTHEGGYPLVRLRGSCMAYAQIASGRIDVGIDVNFSVHDYLALVPVIEGAGGVVTDWRGQPLTLASGGRFVAAGDRRTHAEALAVLAGS